MKIVNLLIMKNYRISSRRFRKIIKSYQAKCRYFKRHSEFNLHLWSEQLNISDKLRNWIKVLSILDILLFLCLLVLIFFIG